MAVDSLTRSTANHGYSSLDRLWETNYHPNFETIGGGRKRKAWQGDGIKSGLIGSIIPHLMERTICVVTTFLAQMTLPSNEFVMGRVLLLRHVVLTYNVNNT